MHSAVTICTRLVAAAALLCCAAAAHSGHAAVTSPEVPLSMSEGLLNTSQRNTLGLPSAPGVETLTVFRPEMDDNTFNHGAVVTRFDGRLYVQWQTSKRDEDSSDTHVVYSSSQDGRNWTAPARLVDSPRGSMTTSGGWWQHDDKLIAFINVWSIAGDIKKGGTTMFVSSRNGKDWSELNAVVDNQGEPIAGIFEQDPRSIRDGRVLSAFHLQPGLVVAPFFTDDPSATSEWVRGTMQNLPFSGKTSRAMEPSWYRRKDGALVMIFRDQAETFVKLASISNDRGETWSTPVLTNIPDARTKQSAGNLPDGSAFLVGNPVTDKSRHPLVLMLSTEGKRFDSAWLLRGGGSALPPMRYPGRYKRAGYSYPKSAVIDGWLYVAYATNKEDIELNRVPLSGICECNFQ